METSPVDYKEAIEGLNKAIYHLTWLGRFWGPEGVIALDEIRAHYLKEIGEKRKAFANLQSTYYAAAGNAYAQATKRRFFKKLTWLIRASQYVLNAEIMSDNVVRISGGIEYMTPEELDIRSHILRKGKKRREALQCIEQGLSRQNVSSNSKALLLMGKAEIFAHQGNFGAADAAYAEALSLKEYIPPSTYVRILKSIAGVMTNKTIEERKKLLQNAKLIAKEVGLRDQVEKIEAIERSL